MAARFVSKTQPTELCYIHGSLATASFYKITYFKCPALDPFNASNIVIVLLYIYMKDNEAVSYYHHLLCVT